MIKKNLLFLLFFNMTFLSYSQNIWEGFEHLFTPVSHYIVHKAEKEISVDGEANELDWQNAEWSEYFRDIEGDLKPKPIYHTHFKMLWDTSNLYIFSELEEPHIWAYYVKHDQIVFHENDFEVFIDPDRNAHDYFEFEINAQNTLFDLYLPKPYRNGGPADLKWNAKGFKSAISIVGTLNNPSDTDSKWSIEMAIPFASLTTNGDYRTPADGETWKMNFSRVQWQTEIKNGVYIKKKDPKTKKEWHEDNWVWSPQGIINMHFPERWGIVHFSENSPSQVSSKIQQIREEELVNYLWLIYYKQKEYWNINGRYAATLSEIDFPNSLKTNSNEELTFEMETSKSKFSAFLISEKNGTFKLNQDGLLQIPNN